MHWTHNGLFQSQHSLSITRACCCGRFVVIKYGIIIAVMEGCAATAVQLENEFVQDVGEMTEGSLADTASPCKPCEGAAMSFSDVPAANGASKDEKGEFCRKLEPRDVTSMRENIAKEAQQLIEDINAKRRQDTKLIEDFKKSMELHVIKTCKAVEEMMYDTYEEQSKVMQAKLHELFATLDRISQTENELRKFKESLGSFFQDMSESS